MLPTDIELCKMAYDQPNHIIKYTHYPSQGSTYLLFIDTLVMLLGFLGAFYPDITILMDTGPRDNSSRFRGSGSAEETAS